MANKDYKNGKLIEIIREFNHTGAVRYEINGINQAIAVPFWRIAEEKFNVIPKGSYKFINESGNNYLEITDNTILEQATQFQICYVYSQISSKYIEEFPELSVMVNKYNELVDDATKLFSYLKSVGMTSDTLQLTKVLSQLEPLTTWFMDNDGEIKTLPISDLYGKFQQMIDSLHKTIKDLLDIDYTKLSDNLKKELAKHLLTLEEALRKHKNSLDDYTLEKIEEIKATCDRIIGLAFSKLTKADTIEDLKTMRFLKVGDIVEVLGYYEAGDGAGHKRIIANEDDGSGVQLANGLYANIVHNGEVNVSWFGAKGDGVTDDYNPIVKVINFCTFKTIKALLSPKKYLLKSKIFLENGGFFLEGSEPKSRAVSSTELIFDLPEGTTSCIEGGLTEETRIRHFTFKNFRVTNKKKDTKINGIYLPKSAYVNCENLVIDYCKVGLKFDFSWYINVINVATNYCSDFGIYLYGNQNLLINCTCVNTKNTNIAFGGRNSTMMNCDFSSYITDYNSSTDVGLQILNNAYGNSVISNYFEGYAKTMIKILRANACYFGGFDISILDVPTGTDVKEIKLLDINNCFNSVFSGLYSEINQSSKELDINLGNIENCYGLTIENIHLSCKKGFYISNSQLILNSIKFDDIKNMEYTFNFRKHDYIWINTNNINSEVMEKCIGLDYISRRSNINLNRDKYVNREILNEMKYKIDGDMLFTSERFPNTAIRVNDINFGWLSADLKDRYMKLDTPYWKTILEQEGIWQDLVTYLNAKRNYYITQPSEKLKQFCETNNIY